VRRRTSLGLSNGGLILLLAAGCATAPKDAAQVTLEGAVAHPHEVADGGAPAAANPFAVEPLKSFGPMEVVKLADPAAPAVELRAAFLAGAADDPPGKEGLTALTTRLIVEGGTQRLTASQLLDALYPLAGRLSSEADEELTLFNGRVHADKAPAFIELFAEVLTQPRLDARELERLRSQALNSVRNRLRGENDEELSKVALEALLFPGHPYRHFNGGTEAGLAAITLDDVRAHARAVFTKDRLILGLAGPVDGKLEALLKDKLAALPDTGRARAPLPPTPGIERRTWILKRDTQSTAAAFGLAWPLRRGHPDFAAVTLGLSYLGQHRQAHGVLFTELREKRGMNYGTYAYAEAFQQDRGSSQARPNVTRAAQYFSVWVRPVESKNAVFATRAVLHSLGKTLGEPLPEAPFETARGFLIGFSRAGEQTAARRLGMAIDERLYGAAASGEGWREALGKLTRDEVQAALKRHLDPARLNFVFVTRDAEGLKAALASGVPSPIAYAAPKDADVTEADAAIATRFLTLDPEQLEVLDAQAFMAR
jgi:zinc protease